MANFISKQAQGLRMLDQLRAHTAFRNPTFLQQCAARSSRLMAPLMAPLPLARCGGAARGPPPHLAPRPARP